MREATPEEMAAFYAEQFHQAGFHQKRFRDDCRLCALERERRARMDPEAISEMEAERDMDAAYERSRGFY